MNAVSLITFARLSAGALAYDPQDRFDSMADFCTAIGGSRSSRGRILAVAVAIVALLAIILALVSNWSEPASKSGVSAESKAAETVLTVPNTAATVSGSNLSILPAARRRSTL